jgi:hypothetical protein
MTNNLNTQPSAASGKPASPVGGYLKYAIGEIVLVVIGILIALWINNWNEERKAKQIETGLLEKLQVENELNMNSLVEDVTYREELIPIYYAFIEYLSNNERGVLNDSLEYYMGKTLRTTTYTFTQNSLVNFISAQRNDFTELNKEITLLQNLQNDLRDISEKCIDIKIENYYQTLENDIDFYTGEIYSTESLNSLAFRNNLLLIAGVEEEIGSKFSESLDQMKKVDSLITSYLKLN